MSHPAATAIRIRKEDIPALTFSSEEVLDTQDQIAFRMSRLQKGMRGGNANKHKVRVFFRDVTGRTFEVETTIWAVTPQRVVFKHGTTVPVCRVSEVKL